MKYLLAIIVALSMSSVVHAKKKVMLFGGLNNKVYLGCYNCSELSPESLFNDIGKYESDISQTSIFNDISQYGSSISRYSPCNELASNPPVLVNEDGAFYGYLTLNEYKPNAVRGAKVLAWLKYKVCNQ